MKLFLSDSPEQEKSEKRKRTASWKDKVRPSREERKVVRGQDRGAQASGEEKDYQWEIPCGWVSKELKTLRNQIQYLFEEFFSA